MLETLDKIINSAKRSKTIAPIPEAVAVWYSPSTLPQLAALQTSISRIKNKKQNLSFSISYTYNWIKHNRKLLNSGGLKPDRVPLFQTLLDLIEKHRRVNQYE